jgi:type I restriction-modification system DNA methylase subunit
VEKEYRKQEKRFERRKRRHERHQGAVAGRRHSAGLDRTGRLQEIRPPHHLPGDTRALDEPDEDRSVGAFILPDEARWENIVRHTQADDIKVRLDNILELLERTYPEKLRGLLPRIYAGSNLARENVTGLINLKTGGADPGKPQ